MPLEEVRGMRVSFMLLWRLVLMARRRGAGATRRPISEKEAIRRLRELVGEEPGKEPNKT